MRYLRANQTVALAHPAHGAYCVVKEGDTVKEDDPIAATYPWAFDTPVETATAAPGEKRSRRKPASDA